MIKETIDTTINTLWDTSIIPTLSHYITIPNKSPLFDPDWEKNGYMDEAVALMTAWCQNHAPAGMHLEVLRVAGRTPLIYMDIPGSRPDASTILFYGHLDKQPEMTGWDSDLDPWKPVLKGDKLYGRGGADDGYAIFATVTAILALQADNIPHSRCVILIEASEESGSVDLPFYLDKLGDRIGTPELVICTDSGSGNYEQMWMTTSLRGNVTGELSVSLLREGIHSGAAGGMVADSFLIARQLLSRIEDEKTGEVLIKSCHVPIPADRIEEATLCAQVLNNTVYTELPFQSGGEPMTKDVVELLLNRSWRPALSITGAEGLPALKDSGNVNRPLTSLKLSLRLPAGADPNAVVHEMKTLLENNPPFGAHVTFKPDDARAMGWSAPLTVPWLKAAVQKASDTFFGKPCVCVGEGGTIPFIAMMGEKFPASQFVITGVLGPGSNAHGPNEFLHIPMVKKLTGCIAMIVAEQYEKDHA